MNITSNGKTITIVTVRKLSTSKYKTKSGKKEKVVHGITLPNELMKSVGMKEGKYVQLSANAKDGSITAKVVNVKDVEKMQSASKSKSASTKMKKMKKKKKKKKKKSASAGKRKKSSVKKSEKSISETPDSRDTAVLGGDPSL